MSILDIPVIARIRRNHALEHATIHVWSQRLSGLQLVGRSSASGFYIYGKVDTERVASAASEALARLQQGEVDLAVHPRCGTNIATAGILAGFSSFAVLSGRSRTRIERLPQVVLAATLAILLAQPLGQLIQSKVTTTSDLHSVRIKEIIRQERGSMVVHHVRVTEG